ncbi:MAG: hypothetical protein ACREJD_00425 [Phycisphaerales bacterium]
MHVLAQSRQCLSEVEAWYRQKLQELYDAQNKARDQNWDEARRAREAWDESMRQKFKEIGLPNIKDFLKSGLITTDITLVPDHITPERGASGGQGGSTSTGSGGVHYEPPCIYETIHVQGGVSADSGDSVYSTYVSGSMVVCWDTTVEPGTLRGQIISAELGLWSTYPPVTLTLDTTSARTIEAFESGDGRVPAWFKISIPFTPWAAIMQDSVYLDMPLTYSSENGFALALNGASVDSLVPRYRSPFSDFNHDGVYNLASDLAAFMTAFNVHDLRTDRNSDGVWNQLDIDLWNEEFARDSAP